MKKVYEWMIKWSYSIVFQISYDEYLTIWKDYSMVNWEINNEFYCHYTSEKNPACEEILNLNK